ncbi:MAG: ATP-binding protein [Xanthobacteraceae bacterium]
MPDTIRAVSGSIRAHTHECGFLAASCVATLSSPAQAKDWTASVVDPYLTALSSLDSHQIVALTLTLGVLCFAVVSAILLVRTRAGADHAEADARGQIVALKTRLDRSNVLLLSEPQIIVSWAAAGGEPDIIGETNLVAPSGAPHRVLAFGTWLDAEQARDMEQSVENLRASGESFAMRLTALSGRPLEADGRAIGGCAVLRLRDVSGIKRELSELTSRHEQLANEVESLRTLITALPSPVWMRDAAGRLVFVNGAYARAVEAKSETEAVEKGLELLDSSGRDEVATAKATGRSYTGHLPAIVAGARRIFDVIDVPTHRGSAGIGIDVSDMDRMRTGIARMVDAHRRTLDQLTTGVAIFAADQKLMFYNAAYRALWNLDAAFLDQQPTDTAVLDRLRAARNIPEEDDFRKWKAQLHEAYRATEAKEDMWHLPDGRTLRVVTTPNPEGGVTYLFDDVSERLDFARRYDSLIRVQGETLDNLAEGVAVFGSDGRLRLHNPAFERQWRLGPETLADRPHIESVIARCRALYNDAAFWGSLRAAVTGIDDRASIAGRLERLDGSVIDCATVPLPDGATLVTFQDLTDTVNVERALRERNEALEAADELKIDFVHHVSYELRSPLTNIIGFAHFLGDPMFGPLTDKQREYLGYITVSTNALLAIINNILDLATIDAGAMALNLGLVDIRATMEAAAEGIQDRLVKSGIRLDLQAAPDLGNFTADERRVRQILFNLLANAISFSPPGETVTLAAERRDGAVAFSVTDRGPGIPPDVKDKVFDWFETHSLGSRHRGTGLGLSLVRSFVELHGGSVRLDSAVGRGTTVTCVFPVERAIERTAAE